MTASTGLSRLAGGFIIGSGADGHGGSAVTGGATVRGDAAGAGGPMVAVPVKKAEVPRDLVRAFESGRLGVEVSDFGYPSVLNGEWAERLSLYREAPALRLVSVHGPFLDLNPTSPEPGVAELTRARYLLAVRIAGELGAGRLVLHTQFNANLRLPRYPARWVEENVRFWSGLLPVLEAARVTVTLENMWDPCPDYIAELLDRVASPHLAACLDVGHAHLFSRVPVRQWVRALGPHLVHVHLSDNSGGWDEHLAVGDGSVDFEAFFAALAEDGLHEGFHDHPRR